MDLSTRHTQHRRPSTARTMALPEFSHAFICASYSRDEDQPKMKTLSPSPCSQFLTPSDKARLQYPLLWGVLDFVHHNGLHILASLNPPYSWPCDRLFQQGQEHSSVSNAVVAIPSEMPIVLVLCGDRLSVDVLYAQEVTIAISKAYDDLWDAVILSACFNMH